MGSALVVENDPTDDVRRLGEWLTEAGLALDVRRPYAGETLPEDLSGHAALVVLGGEQHAHPGPGGAAGAPWFPQLEGLLRKAVRHRVPALAVCLGAQLLATAHGGVVRPSETGPEIGPRLVARRDAAAQDPLFQYVPLAPDVLQWHHDEISELPVGAVLLAASPRHAHQAFRLGDRAWGVQFHLECDTDMFAGWVAGSAALLDDLGYDAGELVERVDALMPDLTEIWQPFAARFAALAIGSPDQPDPVRRSLPVLGQ